VMSNGTLVFLPFGVDGFRASIHAATYHCRASSSAGTTLTRDLHVRAVVEQYWEVRVSNVYAQEGNMAVLSCTVPSYVKDFVTITSWTQGHVNYYPQQHADGRVQMVSSGQLVIKSIQTGDSQLRFRCRAVHTLSGETRESQDHARIYITESRVSVAPSIPETEAVVTVPRGASATLLCPATAHPPPTITWYRSHMRGVGGGGSMVLYNGGGSVGGRLLVAGPVLTIMQVDDQDSATYTCVANNTHGTSSRKMELQVMSALSVR
ncbi:unnamed protein product, partial [Meganyctiphanes norvegica]